MHLELILNASIYLYIFTSFLGLLYWTLNAQKSKSTLLKLDFIISFQLLFLSFIFCVFSNFFTSKSLISSLQTTQLVCSVIIALALLTPISLIFTYFLHQNLILGWLDEKFYHSRYKDALKLTFLVILSIFSFFIICDFMFEYFLIGINFRMNFAEKLASFLLGFAVILSYFYAGNFFIQGVVLNQIITLKKAVYMEFECGIFQENVINEEIGVNSDELQSMIERYKMTGNRPSKRDKQKMNELVSKQNLLIHRRKLTNQFVTKKAKILQFLAKVLTILMSAIKVLLAFLFMVSLGISILGTWYTNDKAFNENLIEMIIELMSKSGSAYIPLHWSHVINAILVKIVIIGYVLYHTKEFFLCESESKFAFLDEKENEIRSIEKELNEVKKYFNLMVLFFFSVWLTTLLMPKYNLFIPGDECSLGLWKEENFVLLKKKCETTLIGEVFLLIMQRKEIKMAMALLNIFFLARLALNVAYGFLSDRKKADQIKVI